MQRLLRHTALRMAATAAAAALTACAALSGLDQPPRVTLVGVEPVQIQLLEQRYLATIRIQNPNPVALPVSGLDYTITINGAEFASGVSNQRVSIPAYGEKTLAVGVTSTIARLLDQVRLLGESGGALRYGISGRLGVTGMPAGVPFDQQGEIDLRPPRATRGHAA